MGLYFYLESYGCPSNTYDLMIVRQRLLLLGLVEVDRPEKAELLFVNTCAVKKRTEDRILSRLGYMSGLKKAIVIGGCLPMVNLDAVKRVVPEYLAVLGPNSLGRIDELVFSLSTGLGKDLRKAESLEKVGMAGSWNGVRPCIVPIAEGCLGKCGFCCTRLARGQLFSYSIEAIVREVKERFAEGAREFWLVAQDTGAYGLDRGLNLPMLLDEICKVEGRFMVRVGMMNPEHCIAISERLFLAFQNPKIFKFLHIPLQSGSNHVLRSMGRRYTVEEFMSVADSFRKVFPRSSLWTDIICGFPTEKETYFEDSIEIIGHVKPDTVNVSKFSSRPGTQASRLKPLSTRIVKQRSRRMAAICGQIAEERNLSWVGWCGDILLDEYGKGDCLVGHNFAYKPVVVKMQSRPLFSWLNVKITGASLTNLVGMP